MDKEFLEGLPCAQPTCRLTRLPNVAVSHEHQPAVVDRLGKVIQEAVTNSEIAYEVACATCGKTFTRPEVNGVKGAWAEKESAQ
jgi:hypothetical protein